MRTSDRLAKITEALQEAGREMKRLEVDLPDGATLEILESRRVQVESAARALETEAANLRRFRD